MSITGAASDRPQSRAPWLIIVCGCAIAALTFGPRSAMRFFQLPMLAAAVMGLLWLSTVPPTNGLVAVMFGTPYLGMLGGVVFLSHQIGSFLGVWLGGYLYERFGSYDRVWWLGVALGIFAMVVHLPIKEQPAERALVAAPAE